MLTRAWTRPSDRMASLGLGASGGGTKRPYLGARVKGEGEGEGEGEGVGSRQLGSGSKVRERVERTGAGSSAAGLRRGGGLRTELGSGACARPYPGRSASGHSRALKLILFGYDGSYRPGPGTWVKVKVRGRVRGRLKVRAGGVGHWREWATRGLGDRAGGGGPTSVLCRSAAASHGARCGIERESTGAGTGIGTGTGAGMGTGRAAWGGRAAAAPLPPQ